MSKRNITLSDIQIIPASDMAILSEKTRQDHDINGGVVFLKHIARILAAYAKSGAKKLASDELDLADYLNSKVFNYCELSQEAHERVMDALEKAGYKVVIYSDFDGTDEPDRDGTQFSYLISWFPQIEKEEPVTVVEPSVVVDSDTIPPSLPTPLAVTVVPPTDDTDRWSAPDAVAEVVTPPMQQEAVQSFGHSPNSFDY